MPSSPSPVPRTAAAAAAGTTAARPVLRTEPNRSGAWSCRSAWASRWASALGEAVRRSRGSPASAAEKAAPNAEVRVCRTVCGTLASSRVRSSPGCRWAARRRQRFSSRICRAHSRCQVCRSVILSSPSANPPQSGRTGHRRSLHDCGAAALPPLPDRSGH